MSNLGQNFKWIDWTILRYFVCLLLLIVAIISSEGLWLNLLILVILLDYIRAVNLLYCNAVYRQKYILQFFKQSWSERKCDIFLYRKLNFWIFNDYRYIMTVWIFFFHWILRMIDKKKKHSYMYLIKELIKVFDGHIHLYILQSLSSMFANIGMCCVHRRNMLLILWILQF